MKHADDGYSLDAPAVSLGTKTNNRLDADGRVKFDRYGRLQLGQNSGLDGPGNGEKCTWTRREAWAPPTGDLTSVAAMQRRVFICRTGQAGALPSRIGMPADTRLDRVSRTAKGHVGGASWALAGLVCDLLL